MFTSRLLVVLGITLAVGGWFLFRVLRAPKELQQGRGLVTIALVVGLFIRLIYVFFTPPFFAPDERPHFRYIVHLAEQGSFPVQKHMYGDASQDWEFCQPPLYYLILTPLYAIANSLFSNAGTVIVLRLVSVLFWMLNVWVAWLVLKRAQITDSYVRGFVVSMLSLLPTYTFMSAMINNDNLLALIGTSLVYLMFFQGVSIIRSMVIGLCLGLALLTKQSAALFVPALFVHFILKVISEKVKWRLVLLNLIVSFGLALLLFGPWALRNLDLYGSLTPEQVWVKTRTWPSVLYGLGSALHNLVKSFWAVSGNTNQFGYPFPLLGYAFVFMCVTLPWMAEEKADPLKTRENQPFLAGCLVAIIVNVLLVLQFGYRLGMGQGRHLFPVLVPITLFLAAPWRRFPVRTLEPWTTAIWIAYGLSFQAYSLWRFPVKWP